MTDIRTSCAAPKNTQFKSPTAFFTKLPFTSDIERRRRQNLSRTLAHALDRVNILGDDGGYGHTGCVNALSWTQDGDALLSAGDDTTVRIWRLDSSNYDQDYPFVCRSVINTGHRANIFSAKMLPMSSRIATAAGDSQIRVFDVPGALDARAAYGDTQTDYSTNQSCIRVIQCHQDSVRKIITEESPDLFLSVSEDGSVRQHDLRTPHSCRAESCPAPLVDIGHELNALSLSPLVPYQFVVAGEGSYGYLFDRRYLRHSIEHDWGMVPEAGKDATTCVRKFGRGRSSKDKGPRRDHITGARMSKANGHQVLLSYSGDGVYLFSTKDEPQVKEDFSRESPSPSHAEEESMPVPDTQNVRNGEANEDEEQGSHPERVVLSLFDHLISPSREIDSHPDVPVVMPRRCYTGARNVMTVKDVNFLGPDDEWVVSGSDDGNFFIWDKDTGALQGLYEGDGSVVNVIEGHPHFPLVAVSGIDTTVKLFAPTESPSSFSRMDNAEQIMNANQRQRSTRFRRYDISALFREDPDAMSSQGVPTRVAECIGQ